MSLSYELTDKVRAVVVRATAAVSPHPLLSVIPSSASRPSYKGWASGGCRRAHARAPSRLGLFPPILLTRGSTTNQRYLVDNGNNMQSVKNSIVIGDNVEDYSIKGIFNDICLTSNVSVILCVPRLMNKDNCYSDIDTVTEPMQCTNCSTATTVADTNNFGASTRVDEDESQRFNIKKIDSNIYSIVFVNNIQSNQMIGATPNYCIPVKNNAITVQGISCGDPHSSSFNLNSNMASMAPRSTNKSDYAFKTSVCIKEEASRERMASDGSHAREIVNKVETRLTYDEMLAGEERARGAWRALAALDGADGWGAPRRLRLRGGGESSVSNASGWGTPPTANNNGNHTCLHSIVNKVETRLTYDEMLAGEERARGAWRALAALDGADGWGAPRRLRLRGGGESSVSNASGWGTPPTANNNGNHTCLHSIVNKVETRLTYDEMLAGEERARGAWRALAALDGADGWGAPRRLRLRGGGESSVSNASGWGTPPTANNNGNHTCLHSIVNKVETRLTYDEMLAGEERARGAWRALAALDGADGWGAPRRLRLRGGGESSVSNASGWGTPPTANNNGNHTCLHSIVNKVETRLTYDEMLAGEERARGAWRALAALDGADGWGAPRRLRLRGGGESSVSNASGWGTPPTANNNGNHTCLHSIVNKVETRLTYDEMLAGEERARGAWRALAALDGADGWGAPRRLRLRGGGESSVSNASGWGTPPTANNNGNHTCLHSIVNKVETRLTYDEMLAGEERARGAWRALAALDGADGWGAPRRLRLRGGGESSVSNASGWGTPPTANNNGNHTCLHSIVNKVETRLTYDEMLAGEERARGAWRALAALDGADGWGAPRRLRLRGGGESSVSNASGWGTPPTANNNGNHTCLHSIVNKVETRLTYDEMLAGEERARGAWRALAALDGADGWGAPRRLRLRGGGESSVSNASGWGTPPTANNNAVGNWGAGANGQAAGGNPQQWPGSGQRPPGAQPDMNSNKSSSNGTPASGSAAAGGGGGGGGGGGWPGGPAGNMPATPNNNAPPPPNNGTPNSGGNSAGNNSPSGSSNGNAPPPPPAAGAAAASVASSAKIEQLNSMREALYSQDGWGGQHVNQDTNWDVPGTPEPGVKMDVPAGAPPPWKPNINNGTDLWEANLRNGGLPTSQPAPKTPWGHTPTTNIGGTWGEEDDIDTPNLWSGPPPPQQWAGGPPQQPQHWGAAKKDDWGAWGEPHRPLDPRFDAHRAPEQRPLPPDPRHEHLRADLRGDMRGISGRLNGDMWGQHHPNAPAPNKMMPGGGVNQWGAQPPKEPVKGGWEEPSPPAARRAATGFDDGTSLWSGRGGGGGGAGGMGGGRGGAQGPPAPQRAPPAQVKPDNVWGQAPRNNASWEDGPHVAVGAAGWGEREAAAWPDASAAGLGWPKPKPPGPGGAWPDEIGEWGGPKPPPGGPGKLITKEALWSSKQFRVLVDMGYKKEDVEAALRRADMNTEEALEMLSPMRGGGGGAGVGGGGGGEAWRARDDHFPPHHGPFPHAPPGALSAVSPAVAHKMLGQPPQPPQHHHHPPYNHLNSGSGGGGGGGGGGAGGQPSATQLRMLVQQIQMAVSAGYLNHQILNQPLAPQTLVLLNQLLQQIKGLQQLVTQHSLALSKNNTALGIHCSVQITKAKQQISNLQNQIAAQQAIYVKQQTGGAELFSKQPPHDPLAQLQNNFSDMGISKEPQQAYGVQAGGNQQSRLTQWKLPSLDNKDGEGSEFSRAPGTAKSATSPQLNLALQSDTTWGRSGVGEAWGEVGGGADVGDGKDSWPAHPAHQPVYDLVPEFEPGKPWKGKQMKNVEDDPAMTPGSVVRSPLSLAAIKDSDMLGGGGGGGGGKASPPAGERSLSSATWSYPPPAAAPLKQPPPDAWAPNKGRAPPPGLTKPWPPQQPQQHHQRNISSWQSTWLLLKNLTAQIDGSTLKTLCMQHGPLLSFHLYLNQGIALARYSSREEANKAQMALNNCVLGNTTIFAESPGESEVQMILQHLGQGGGVGGGGAWRSAAAAAAGKEPSWGGFPSLWSDQHEQRSTPSSLNSFLPPDLLGGESI